MDKSAELDRTYQQAAPDAFGRALGDTWKGMVSTGVPTEEATKIMVAYVQAIVLKPEAKTDG